MIAARTSACSPELYYPWLHKLRPMVDVGAHYSSIAYIVLQLLNGRKKVERRLLSDTIQHFTFFQFGFEAHALTAKPILGSAMLLFMSNNGRLIEICHIIFDWSSRYILCRNVKIVCDIIHFGALCQCFPPDYGKQDLISLIYFEHHS